MKRIINADDFGLTQGVNRGIIEAHKEGIVTSTTLMATSAAFDDAVALAKATPTLGVGVHLVLSTQTPLLTTHQTLVNEQGNFKYKLETIDSELSLEEVYQEWRAQIEKVRAVLPITHFDSHHYMHLHPRLLPVAQRLGAEYQLPMRSERNHLPQEVKSNAEFYDSGTYETLQQVLSKPDELLEIACHPAYVDDELRMISSYSEERDNERQLLTGKIKEYAAAEQIELIHYGQL